MPPLLKGAVLGLSIAAPVGPIGLLCIQRSMASGRGAGLACGLGAATADAFYGAVAAFGLAAVSSFLLHVQTPLQLCGGLFLLYLGVSTLRQKPTSPGASLENSPHVLRLFISTCLLTLANPMTILSFSVVFAGVGLGTELAGSGAALSMVIGVFLGSALWWCILSSVAARLGARLTPKRLRWINVLAGISILVFATWQLSILAKRGVAGEF